MKSHLLLRRKEDKGKRRERESRRRSKRKRVVSTESTCHGGAGVKTMAAPAHLALTEFHEDGRAGGGLLKVVLGQHEHPLVSLDVLEGALDAGEEGGQQCQRCYQEFEHFLVTLTLR